MRFLGMSLLAIVLAATVQAEDFTKEKIQLGKKKCLCDFSLDVAEKCKGTAKCDKKCSGSGEVEIGGCSFTLVVKKGKGKISKCSCETAPTLPPTETTINTGSGSGETPVPMTGSGSGETPVPITGSGSEEPPMPITGSGSGPVPITGSGAPPAGGEGMQCSCKCDCPDGSGECDCDCNCPMTSKAVNCAPGFSKVCPMMGDACPQDMEPICPNNAMGRMAGGAGDGHMADRGCQCVPDFLMDMVKIQPLAPAGRMTAVDRAMTKATIQVGKKKCKCSYEMNAKDCKKSKITCDKKCSGKASGVELEDGMYMLDIAVKKGKVTIAKCDVQAAPAPTGTGGGSGGGMGSGSGSGGGGMGGIGSRCACVSVGMGGTGPVTPTGSGSGTVPTGSGSGPVPTGSGSGPATILPPTGSGSGSGADPSLEEEYNGMTPPMTKPQRHIHDPSELVATDGLLMIANTGKETADGYNCGLETWYLTPGQTDWQPGQCLLKTKPAWVKEEIPANGGAYWAPAFLSPRILYYSVSGGEEVDAQCIGLATATGTAPDLAWTDSGEPITCTFNAESNNAINMPNSIDPAVFIDDDGSQHLVYGGGRIWMTELDKVSGKQIEENWWSKEDPKYHFLAKGPPSVEDPGETSWIEAPFIHKQEGYYYLFVNWFGCCNGVDSTYEIHMGRSSTLTGPYLDKSGVAMTEGGGSLLIEKDGKYIGPGHPAVFAEGGRYWFSFHYYDGTREGLPWVEVRRMDLEAGWPLVTGERFNSTEYFGL